MNIIEVKHVTKDYRLYNKNSDIVKELLFKKSYGQVYKALNDINFNVKKGTTYGVVGTNGSGKSTILKLINGTVYPTSGEINVKGTVSLLNVGAGIVPKYTGIENIYYKCTLFGLKEKEIKEKFQSIIEFSELGDFINQPVNKYSSGMKSKLGFAIAIHLEADVLIIDEALAVGDKLFKNKCNQKMNELKAKGTTILFVSHSSGQMKKFCDRACWIQKGELMCKGEVKDIMKIYDSFLDRKQTLKQIKKTIKENKAIYMVD